MSTGRADDSLRDGQAESGAARICVETEASLHNSRYICHINARTVVLDNESKHFSAFGG
jgi:hypothetical protein